MMIWNGRGQGPLNPLPSSNVRACPAREYRLIAALWPIPFEPVRMMVRSAKEGASGCGIHVDDTCVRLV
jgi:hypothetical protein